MKINIDTPQQSDTDRLGQILNYYHVKLDEKVECLDISLLYRNDPQGHPRYLVRVNAMLGHGDDIRLDEIQTDLLTATNRIMHRLIRSISRQHKGQAAGFYSSLSQ